MSNWYKKSSDQKEFPFLKDVPITKRILFDEEKDVLPMVDDDAAEEADELFNLPESIKPPITETEEFRKLEERTPKVLQDIADGSDDIQDFLKNIRSFGYKAKKITDKEVSVWVNDKEYKVKMASTHFVRGIIKKSSFETDDDELRQKIEDEMSGRDSQVEEYLAMHKAMQERMGGMEGYYYKSVPDLLLQEGKKFESQPLNKEEFDCLKKVEALANRYKAKQCFYNAQDLALMHPQIDYVEGYMFSVIPFQHAWNSINGKVIDFTMSHANNGSPVLGIIPDGWEYYGIILPKAPIRQFWAKHGFTDSQLDNYHDGFPLLKKKFSE